MQLQCAWINRCTQGLPLTRNGLDRFPYVANHGTHAINNISRYGGVYMPPFDTQTGVWHPNFEISHLINSPIFSVFCFANICMLMPDSEGHKPNRNNNSSCGVTLYSIYT